MHQYALARAQALTQSRARVYPTGLEALIRNVDVADRQPVPLEPRRTRRLWQRSDTQQRELVFLEQRNDARRAPAPDHIQIRLETALPARTLHAVAFLAGAEARPQPPLIRRSPLRSAADPSHWSES